MKTLYTTYNNFAKRLVMSLIVLMTVGVGSVLGETATFTWGTNPSAYTKESSSFSEGQVTFTGTEGSGSTATRAWDDGLRMYAGGTAEFSVPNGYIITKIEGYTTFNFDNPTGQQSVKFTALSKATCKNDVIVTYTSSGYTITYETNGGSAVSSTTGTKLPNPLPTTTKTGYTFAGWYTNSNLITAATAGATINADITLYAKWTPTQYTITYNGLEGATHNNPTNYTIESETITFTAPSERVGYNFTSWNPSSITKGSTGNKTITAQWTAKDLTNYRTSCGSAATLVSIALSGQTTTYNVGDSFSFDGTCTATYDDESTKTVTPTSVSSPDMSTAGTKTVTVSYTEGDKTVTTTYEITVNVVKTATSLSWSAATYTATIASPSNEFPTLTINPDAIKESITYSSSNETVATIDAAGNIRLLAAGTTTITASYAGDEDYAAAEDAYDLTVEKSTNCRWEEVTIDDIEYGDEVVIAMEKNGYTYALQDNDGGTSSAPLAVLITINPNNTINTLETPISTPLIWNIDYDKENTKNLVIYSTKNVGKWLYSINNNDGVRIGTNTNKEFKIVKGIGDDAENTFLYHVAQERYLGVYYAEYDWRGYKLTDKGAFPNYIKGQTLKFYKKTCLPENEYWVNYNLENVSCTTNPLVETITSTSEGFELTFEAADGYILTDDIEVQMEGGTLETKWVKDKGELTINKPVGGFTGNITISLAACLSLPAPENLDAKNITSSSVTLTWDAVDGAQSYEVFVTDFDKQDITRSNLTECQVTISELTKNTEFTWDVRAVAEGYCGIPSELGYFQTLQTYTVTFDNNGHANAELMPATQTVDDGSLAQEPADDPSDNGYSFGGWYDNKNCEGEPFSFLETPITANTVLYAKWDVVTYNITYAGLEGATNHADNPASYTIETPTITFLAPSTRSGYIFSGWNPATLEKGSYGNKTITATWEKGKIVTWIADGEEIESQTYASEDKLVLPTQEIEPCQGSAFMGWTDDEDYFDATTAPTYVTAGSEVTVDATYYAVYANLEGDNTDYSDVYTSNVAMSGTSAKVVINSVQYDAIKAGTTKNAGSVEITIPAGTTKLCFHMAGWNGENGKTISLSGATAKPASFATVADEGISGSGTTYTLKGDVADYVYSTNLTNITEETTITLSNGGGNQRFVVWGVNASSASYKNYSTSCSATYYVNYDLAGGENGCEDGSVKVGSDYNICADEPTKTGYTFQGWNDGTTTHAAGATIENVQENITLTAVWKANEYTITWMSNGEEQGTTTHTYDQPLKVADAPYNCYGAKTFVGWTEDETVEADGSDITYVDETTNPSEDKTYYAVFAEIQKGTGETIVLWNETFGNAGTENIAWSDDYSGFTGKTNGVTYAVSTSPAIKISKKSGGKVNSAIYSANAGEGYFIVSGLNTLGYQNINLTYNIKLASTSSQVCKVTINEEDYVHSSLENNTWYEFSCSNLPAQENLIIKFYLGSSAGGNYLDEIVLTGVLGDTYSNYTTTPNGCPKFEVAENAYVTSAKDQSVKVKIPIKANNFANDMAITAAVDHANFSVANVSAVTDGACTVTLAYTPTESNTTESATVTLTAKADDKEVTSTTFTVNGRSLPERFVIATKVGVNWYALPANMSGATNPEGVLIEVDETTMTATSPNTASYTLFSVKTTDTQYDRFAQYGDRVRFSAVNNEYKGLWATSDGTTINNSAQIKSASDGGTTTNTNPSYEWKITTTVVDGNWQYTLQTDQEKNQKYLRYWTGATGSPKWGTYAAGNDQLYFLPVTETEPFDYQVVEWYPTKMLIQTDATIANPTAKIGDVPINNVTCTNKGSKLYEISGLPLVNNPTKVLTLSYTADEVTYNNSKVVPIILSRETKSISGEPFVALTKEVYNYADLVVRDGATLTMDGTQEANTLWDVTIYPTSKISVPESKKLTVHSLTLFGGIDEIYNGSTYTLNKYGVPELSLKGSLKKSISTIDYLMRVNLDQMYSLAVPYDVQLADIKYWDGSDIALGSALYVSAYDGEARAKQSKKTWIYETDFESRLGAATLKAGVGYTISAELQAGVGKEYSILRMPMMSNVASGATEAAKTVAVTAWGKDANVTDNHKGWNLVGNPYMTTIKGADDDDLVLGYLQETGTGPWEWVEKTYRYVTIPSDDGTYYWQQKFTDAVLPPFKNFFVQIGTTGDLQFGLGTRQSMPARSTQAAIEKEVEFEILMSNDARQDNTGLLISEEYSPAYEINADLEKMTGSMSVYTIFGGYKLAYNALSPINTSEWIPMGYIAPAAGEYTFRLDDVEKIVEQVEHVYVIDYDANNIVDLMTDEYKFTTNKEQNDNRFAINVVLIQDKDNTTTGLDIINGNNTAPIKFIYHDKIYIKSGEVIYDGTGKQVTNINK